MRGFEEDFHEEYFKVEKFLKTKYVKYHEIIYGYIGDLYLLVDSHDKSTICNALKLDGFKFGEKWLVVNIPQIDWTDEAIQLYGLLETEL